MYTCAITAFWLNSQFSESDFIFCNTTDMALVHADLEAVSQTFFIWLPDIKETSVSIITFGVKTLMSSLRKRNLATSPWNLFPQLFIHASRTWKAPNQNKSLPTEVLSTSENERSLLFLCTTKERTDLSLHVGGYKPSLNVTW